MAPAERAGPEDEKITINLGPVDLGRIDLLVREGVFSSRTDFIRDAIRGELEDQAPLVNEVIARRSLTVGFVYQGRQDFETMRKKGEKVRIAVVGVLKIADDVSLELAQSVLESATVLGSVRGPKDVVTWIRGMKEEG